MLNQRQILALDSLPDSVVVSQNDWRECYESRLGRKIPNLQAFYNDINYFIRTGLITQNFEEVNIRGVSTGVITYKKNVKTAERVDGPIG